MTGSSYSLFIISVRYCCGLLENATLAREKLALLLLEKILIAGIFEAFQLDLKFRQPKSRNSQQGENNKQSSANFILCNSG